MQLVTVAACNSMQIIMYRMIVKALRFSDSMLFELRYLDFLVLTIVTAASYVAVVWYLRQNGRLDRFMILGALLIASLLPLGWITTGNADRSSRAILTEQFRRLTPILADEMREKGHAGYERIFEVSQNDPKFKAMILAEKRWLRLNNSVNIVVSDFFTFAFDEATKQYRIIVDSLPDATDTEGGIISVDEGKPIGTPLLRDIGEGKRAFEGGFGFDERIQSECVSAYFPIQDNIGKVKAVLAVDISADHWRDQIWAARSSANAQLFAFAFIALGGILFIGLLRADIRASAIKEEELREAHRIAHEAAEEARRATEAKSQFLANMSHEIRTPMNGVIGLSEFLLQTNLNNQQRQYQNLLLDSARSLLDLLNDILDYSKIEAGKIELESIPLKLEELIAHTLQTLGRRASEKNLEILLHIDDRVPSEVVGDPTRLRQILINLVSNAIKFTRYGEIEINIRVARKQRCSRPELLAEGTQSLELQFSVRDTGIGIPSSQRTRIFESFTQADASTTRDYGGTGLGLAICSSLTKLLGGEIWLESEVGKGSTFYFQIPVIVSQAQELPVDFSSTGQRVLIVDDKATNRLAYSQMLQREGFEIETSEDGQMALKMLIEASFKNRPFDLILLDVMMPVMGGHETLQAMATKQELQGLPVILLSSMDNLASDLPNGAGNVRRQLLKPATRFEVLTAIRDVLTTQPEKTTSVLTPIECPIHLVRVLVADDAPVNRTVAQSLLERRGHQVTTAVDGKDAVEKWREGDFDIILMDIQMPQLDGFAATREIRNAERQMGRRTPIVAMTAHAMQGDRERCLKKGMDGYLSKPFQPAEMFYLVEVLSAKRSSQRSIQPAVSNLRCDDAKSDRESDLKELEAPEPPGTFELDFDKLLSNTGGVHELAQQMIALFLEESKSQLEILEEAISSRDGTEIAKAAHLLRGSVSIFGARQCVVCLRALEATGKSKQFSKVNSHWAELSKAMNTLIDELRTVEPIPETADSRSE